MASWTDAITQFNPYVSTLPVDAMVKVGMQKQAMYEQGVQKIQSQIDQVAGLSMLRDLDKNYLQTKLNELGNNLTSVAAGDFSNFQLVNSVAGMTKQIGRDPFVQAAVSSTENDRKQQEVMDSERKKGTLTPDNELFYNKQKARYLNSGLKGDDGKPITFSGQYVPYFDVFKFAKESFDAVKPDGYSFDQIYMLDANNKPIVDKSGSLVLNPTMTRIDKEGIFPAKVKETLDQIFSDPRVSRQLQITGEYDYASYDENALAEKILTQKRNILNDYNSQLITLGSQKSAGKNVQAQIDAIYKNMAKVDTSYNQYAQMAMSNPDSVRGLLYKDDVTHRYTNMFGWEKKKELVMDNPRWRAEFDVNNEMNDRYEWSKDFEYKQKRDEVADLKWQLDSDQKERHFLITNKDKLTSATGAAGGPTGPAGLTPTQADETSKLDINGLYDSDLKETQKEYLTNLMDFVYEGLANSETSAPIPDWMKKANPDYAYSSTIREDYSKNFKKYNDKFVALNETLKKYVPNGDVSQKSLLTIAAPLAVDWNSSPDYMKERNPVLKDKFQIYSKSSKRFNEMFDQDRDIDLKTKMLNPNYKAYETYVKQNPIYNNHKIYKVDGKDYQIGPEEYKDLAVYVSGDSQNSKDAYERLKRRGMGGLASEVNGMYKTMSPTSTLTLIGTASAVSQTKDLAKFFIGGGRPDDKILLAGVIAPLAGKMKESNYFNYLSTRADVIKETYFKQPVLKVPLLGGDEGVNKRTIQQLTSMVGEYKSGQIQNLATKSDFNGFANSLDKDMKDLRLQARVVPGVEGQKLVEIASYSPSGDLYGKMIIQQDEASSLNIDVNKLYEDRETASIRRKLSRNGKTSYGDPSLKQTYLNGDAEFGRNDIPSLSGSKLDVKANILYTDEGYYPYIYVSDGRTSTVRPLPAETDLQSAISKIRNIDITLPALMLKEQDATDKLQNK